MRIEFDSDEVLKNALREIIEDEYETGFADLLYDVARNNPEWWAKTVVEPYLFDVFEQAFKDNGKELIKECVKTMFEEWEDSFREIFEEEIRKAAVKFAEEKVKGMLK